jgi:sugar-specific transcriptional regulator TrmB
MEENVNYLRKIGLTESEIKVYLALLKLGSASKKNIVKESKIASSKIYEVTDRLIDKGLCGIIIKKNIKHFTAAPPSRLKDYLNKKHEEIVKEEKELDQIIPKLDFHYNKIRENSKVEVFIGWKGMETVYIELLNLAKKNDEVDIIGAGTGKNEEKLELFYSKYGKMAMQKGIVFKVIFNESARTYVSKIEKNIKREYNKRFLFEHTPTEMLIFREGVMIVVRRDEPFVILIRDKESADSFKKYFEELWKIAKK